jgi:hypothetical protein
MSTSKWIRRFLALFVLPVLLSMPISGCEMSCSTDADEGIEETVDEFGDEVEEAADEIGDEIEETAEELDEGQPDAQASD